jgi:hypothetical protein
MFADEPFPSDGEEATLGGLLREKVRGNNGRIMDGRGPGVDGWRKRRWRREDGGCDASDSSSW